MANWSDLKAAVASIVKTNGNKEITGQLLQNVLNNIISNVGLNSSFAGIATPETNPGAPDGNVFYLATTAGTYSNFNGIVINSGEAVILEWKGSWVKKDSGFATQEKLSELGSEINLLEYNFPNKTTKETDRRVSFCSDDESEVYAEISDEGLFAKQLSYLENGKRVDVKDRLNKVVQQKETETFEDEIIFEDEDGNEVAKIDKDGIHAKNLGSSTITYNDVSGNKSVFAIPITFIKNKVVDKQNRCVISFNGDSIIGSQLDDTEESPEFAVGNFPPNMSKMIMARKFYDKYKFEGEDTQFRNLKHPDWVKSGFDKSQKYEPNGTTLMTFNEIETYGCNSADDYAEIEVKGYKWFKLIWSQCSYSGWSVNVIVSVDGGSYVTPNEAGVDLPSTISRGSMFEENSQYNMQVYRLCELNPSKTYKIKIVPKDVYNNITFWGCEYWNNPRLDVVVEAYSGFTAMRAVKGQLDSFYSDWHKPIGVITDILTTNDWSYITSSNETLNGWMESNAIIFNHLKSKGIPVLAFKAHTNNPLTDSASTIAKTNGLGFIDIKGKLENKGMSRLEIVNTTDATHLNNYGQTFYFEELEKIFN